jgi:hypothetical protein
MSDGAELQLVTFERTSAKGVLEKLRRETERIESGLEREFAADHVIKAFWTAWHLHAWLWDAIKERPTLKSDVLQYRGIDEQEIEDHHSFGTALARRFVPLKICRMIAIAPRHVRVVLSPENASDGSTPYQAFDVVGGSVAGGADDLSAVGQPPIRWVPMVIVMGKPVVVARLLNEIESYWVTLIHETGVEQLR